MQSISGKFNHAIVTIDTIDESTRLQIQKMVDNPSFRDTKIVIMPDCHAGAAVCIGFTMMPIRDRIIPDIVGVDIGCGMLSRKFDIEEFDVKAFDLFIKENIPCGFSVHKEFSEHEHCKDFQEIFSDLARRIGIEGDRHLRSIGTLGGGNHFIEAGFSSIDKKLWVTIHSGSRNFGLRTAQHHGLAAKNFCEKHGIDVSGVPFLIVSTPEGQEYLADQKTCVQFARLNRSSMMRKIETFFGGNALDQIESIHNFISEDGIIRKGATPAYADQLLIIPFNMRDGLAICVGKGNKDYNFSAPHGAGRLLSRSKAKEILDVKLFQKEMKEAGVYTTTAEESTLDESPSAYKDKEIILQNIAETVDVIEFVKPVYNFKAGE